MSRSIGPFKCDNPWRCLGWFSATGLLIVSGILGFVMLGGVQQNGPRLGLWAGICHGLGLSSDTEAAEEPQPPLRSPTRISWTSATLAQISGGNRERGEFVAMNCVACHGDEGVSVSGLYPTLAGMDAAVIFKQLDDFRAGKRLWGAMNGIGQALSPEASADVSVYFASLDKGLAPGVANRLASEHALREHPVAARLVLVGDPARGIPPCSACHGPDATKLGAPSLHGQQPAYIERQLAAFAQGMRQNDINCQMRTIAAQLKSEEMHDIAEFYSEGEEAQSARANMTVQPSNKSF